MPIEKRCLVEIQKQGYIQGLIMCSLNPGVPFTFCSSLCLCSLHSSSYFYHCAHCQKGLSIQKPTCISLTLFQSPSFDKEQEQAVGSVSTAGFKVISKRKQQRDLSPFWLETVTSLTFTFAVPVQQPEVQTRLGLKPCP